MNPEESYATYDQYMASLSVSFPGPVLQQTAEFGACIDQHVLHDPAAAANAVYSAVRMLRRAASKHFNKHICLSQCVVELVPSPAKYQLGVYMRVTA